MLSSLYANTNSSVLKNVADGILANNNITNVEVLNVQPVKENETILEIAYKNLESNSVGVVYAISDRTIIVGKKITQANIDDEFLQDNLLNFKFNKIANEDLLKILQENSVSLNNYDNNKKTIYLISNINNNDLLYLTNDEEFKNINLKLLLTNYDNSTVNKTLAFYQKKKFDSLKDFQDFLKNPIIEKEISFEDLKNMDKIKQTILDEDSFGLNERLGEQTLYIYKNQRLNLTQILNLKNEDKK